MSAAGLPRVLHVSQPVEAGVARCVAQYAAAQHAAGMDVVVACPPGGPLSADLRAADVRVVAWDSTRSPGPSSLREAKALAAVIADVQPGLLHLHSSKAGLVGRAAVRGRVPTVFSPHAWSFEAATGAMGAASLRWERFAARWTTLTVCVSEAERRLGEAAGIDSSYAVVANGVDLQQFRAAGAVERDRARSALGLGSGPLVVCVGRLARQKGQDLLLDAWAGVTAAVPGAGLVLVGDGPDREALTRSAATLEGVRLVGGSDDTAQWYAAADVVVVPSRWEGMPLTVLEACASARSVVATDVAGTAECLRDGGVLVPMADPVALSTALAQRLADPSLAAREGAAGRAGVEAHHDVRTSAARLVDAYRSVL